MSSKVELSGKEVEVDGRWYRVYKRYWLDVDLRQLSDNEIVRWGDGETYHELLRPIGK